MPTESAELAREFEDEFGLILKDEDLNKMITPQDVADHVVVRLAQEGRSSSHPLGCRSQMRFHKLRLALIQELGVARSEVRLNTPMGQLLQSGGKEVQKNWSQLRAAVGARYLPGLSCTKEVDCVVRIGAFVLLWVLLAVEVPFGVGVGLSFVAWAVVHMLINMSFLSNQVPCTIATVREMVPYVRVYDAAERKDLAPDEVLKRVIVVTAKVLDMKVGQIRPDSEFVRDMGVDC